MREMTLFEKEAIRTALSKMFEPGHWLDMCTINKALEIADVHPPKRTMDALHVLHCVSWSRMSQPMREASAKEILGLFEHPGFDLPALHKSFLPDVPKIEGQSSGFFTRLLGKTTADVS